MLTAIHLANFDSHVLGRFESHLWFILTAIYLADWTILTDVYLANYDTCLPGRI